MAKKKTTTGQTSARMVMDVLKKHYAFTPDTAVGYDAFKNLRLSTSVIAYTIANLMETDVIMKTDDDRYYFVEKNWNKVVHKVNFAYHNPAYFLRHSDADELMIKETRF